MKNIIYFFAILAAVPCFSEETLSENDAERIGTELYIYGYPLITMDLARQVMTNTEAPEGNKAPMGQFANLRKYPDPSMHEVTAPNADTLYSLAWIDVSNEPYILHVPDEKGRFYLMPMLSGWTDVFADPGTRTTGTKAGDFAITGPGWKGKLPKGVKEFKSPTAMVWILGRTYSSGTPEDYEAVHKIQDQYSLTPLSSYKKAYTPPPGKVDPNIDMTTPVRDQVNHMDAAAFFSRLALLMKDNPPSANDVEYVANMKKIGLIPGQEFELGKLDEKIVQALHRAPELGLEKIMAHDKNAGQLMNGWTVSFKVGNYGTNYLLRAFTAATGLGANIPQDALYPFTKVDSEGNPLNGSHNYLIHFPNEPPVKGFWSLTMYNDQYFFVPNSLNRYSLSPRNSLKHNQDGSIDLYIQSTSPGPDKESNWLPSQEGPFILMLRLYWPDDSILKGVWRPPVVKKE